ncbi:helix-turn-helix transcriptional regulator [Enterococcus sp. LJL128]|uniref:helix-turn-helix transcriptional regulator n=1 Tax=Enterococcus sp. LJL51 TaxID=3416656 RepID=UPI003CF53381
MKNERLLAITMLLLEQKQISAPKLAERFEVSVRTIYRDVDSLGQAGIPITTIPGSKGGIRIMENYKIDQRFFTSSELVSLMISLASLNNHINMKQTQYTLEKLKSLIPQKMEEEIALKTDQLIIDLTPWIRGELSRNTIEAIQLCLDKNQILSIAYENRSGQYSTRKLEPYRLILKEASWYTQAYCLEKQDFRIFKLSRMKNVIVTEDTFVPRAAPPAALGKNTIKEADFTTIFLEVDYSVKDQLLERFPDLIFNKKKNSDYFDVTFPYFIPDDFGYHLLLGFGNRCICHGPAFVREELAQRVRQMLTQYE